MVSLRNITCRLDWSFIGLAACLLFPSISKVQRYLGTVAIVPYILVVLLVLWLSHRYIYSWFILRLTQKQAFWLAVGTIIVLVAAFIVVYPLATSGIVAGGSDRDEALNIATTELLAGRYPYYPRTVVPGLPHQLGLDGHLISPLPGSLLLAIPFVLLGNGAYQNFLWIFLFFLTVRWHLKDGRAALLLVWTMLVLSPICLHEVVTGGDLLANSLWILIFALLMVKLVPNPHTNPVAKVALAILLGVGLSSRPNFVLLLPLVFSMLGQRAGWPRATKYMTLTCLVFAAVTLPFYLYDPQGFSPLHTYDKLAQFEGILPFAGTIIPLVGGVIAVALSLQRMDDSGIVLLRNCALVQAFPIVCIVILSSIATQRLNFVDFAWYGLTFLGFGALAAWISIVRKGRWFA